uniref:DUF2793 domain-containing protein n=1 Tax=uncultured Sphingomonas sp. TaxID=158754 RepID=UPI0025D567E8|nr:DUF2793 domain-containing protein [uncultured Sphingomonas sp.]
MNVSARLALPLLAPGQAQKELFHNEALQALDVIVHGVVQGPPVDEPPTVPLVGASYLIGQKPVGAWQGRAHNVACWTDGGWRFRAPFDGLETTLRSTGLKARFSGGEWRIGIVDASELRIAGEQVVSARRPAINRPAGGSIIDQEARTVVLAILTALEGHGLIAAS